MQSYGLKDEIPLSIHHRLLELKRMYCAVGGMPAAVREYVEGGQLLQVQMEQSSIIQTYRDDFAKYRKKNNAQRLQMTLEKIPNCMGRKLKNPFKCWRWRESFTVFTIVRVMAFLWERRKKKKTLRFCFWILA